MDSERIGFISARKYLVLKATKEKRGTTLEDLVGEMGITRNLASTLLHKYWKRSLLKRSKTGRGKAYTYQLTDKGRKRLEWFEETISPDRAKDLLERETETRGRPKEV